MRAPHLIVVGFALLAGCQADPTDCATAPPGSVCELAGTGQLAFNGDGHPARDTALYLPSAARPGPDGLIYIMDFNNMRLRRIEADDTVSTVAGNGFHAGAEEGSVATQSPLENPIDFAFMPDGQIVFLQYHVPGVQLMGSDGTLQLFAGDPYKTGIPQQPDGDGGPAIQATFVETAGIAVGSDGKVYIADDLNNNVRVIDTNGNINDFAGTSVPGYSGDNGLATAAQLSEPGALAIDTLGDVYIADSGNCAVRKVDTHGVITTVAGIGFTGFDGDTGPATNAELSHLQGLAVADDGTLYISDLENSRIRKVAPDGTITTIAGNGKLGFGGDSEPPLHAEFKYFARIALDTDGSLLIADQGNSRIRRMRAPL